MNGEENKIKFLAEREKIFTNRELFNNSYEFCVKHTLLVEEYIVRLLQHKNLGFVLAAVGGFSRRELSPYSDIDLMFIFKDSDNHESEIQNCVTELWDAGIEVSHTVREFSDIENLLDEDLHAFTQFFETRFLIGDKNIYDQWNNKLFQCIESSNKEKLILEYFDDVEARYKKYGRSPKVLEPNLKFTGGGLRDIHAVEWMYSIKNQKLLSGQSEVIQTELFFKELLSDQIINRKAYKRLFDSYKIVLRARNMLHLIEGRKNDRLEFSQQELIAKKLGYPEADWKEFMHEYFRASTILNRFSKTMMKRYKGEFTKKLSDYLAIDLDDDFEMKGDILFFKNDRILSISDIMRAFYYRCMNDARFEQNLRSLIIESIHLIEESKPLEATSSVFFREMLKLPANVGKTLLAMNEFGFLDILLPEFRNLNGFFQPGVYHCYTADEHTLIALQNVENLMYEDNHLARLFKSLQTRDILYLAILLHDIGKPISVSGHEIIGAEIANSIMQSLGYGQSEIMMVQFLVKYHLEMEQVAFRRDLNDPSTLDNFISIFSSLKSLDFLYLLSYADLSAVNPHVWTQWKAELLYELYSKSKSMLLDQISGEELISEKSNELYNDKGFSDNEPISEHLDLVDDLSYIFHFSKDEITQHLEEIEKGTKVSVFFKENDIFTNITVITKDSNSLLSKLCGALAIQDLNIHDAKIFTRKDGLVIDSFNVSDFRTHMFVSESKYSAIEKSITKTLAGQLNIDKEFEKVKSKWKRIINSNPSAPSKIEIDFEEHNKFTIIDIYGPDKIGLLYTITHKMAELGLTVAFAKISTKVDGVLDAFYIQKNNGEKLRKSEYGFISSELKEEIKKI
ncbi:MAG: HD domain-containing protein [Melioribacteraceae bacterium]|nr:HD domain-containing protein [Melioribacteraceae bacterium]